MYDSIEYEPDNWDIRAPLYFPDLNLDQIIGAILAGKEEYRLEPFFYRSLKDISSINYRLDVMRDVENPDIYNAITVFAAGMKRIREYMGFSLTLHNSLQKKKWLLDAAGLYCETVSVLHAVLASLHIGSSGLRLFCDWLTGYLGSDAYKTLYTDTDSLFKEFGSIRYSVEIEGDRVIVGEDRYCDDYCELMKESFGRINDTVFDYSIRFFTDVEMCSLEGRIIDIISDMYAPVFKRLDEYCSKHLDFMDRTLERFVREIQFYICFRDYIKKLGRSGFCFTYPSVSLKKEIRLTGGYDLALAQKCPGLGAAIVPNDFLSIGGERIFILTGPNQGGKTTFARTVGQIVFFALLGCPVPCVTADICLIDNIFTHFSVEENPGGNTGRLKEELLRLKCIMNNMTANSLIIINELFASTTSNDAFKMGKRILDHFGALDCFCLYVTHIHELAGINGKTVSLVAAVDKDRGAARTYRIIRKQADGRAYANSIAEKYHLTYEAIKGRIGT
ncbi:MAG TPA: DNA mismatch repair protein MutS [Clostridia bacterium]|nr:DNA mismatch repair protein MutS [Clostridia bacterium]